MSVDPFGRHFTASELGEIWKLDETTIRRMFQDQAGVLKVGKSNRRDGKRGYVTMRIPEAVALHVYVDLAASHGELSAYCQGPRLH